MGDKELVDDADLDWYDYGFRSYDAQIGRFPQLDPLTDGYPELTPYQYASCEPIGNVDLDGLEAIGATWGGDFLHNVLDPFTVTVKVSKGASVAAKAAVNIGAHVGLQSLNILTSQNTARIQSSNQGTISGISEPEAKGYNFWYYLKLSDAAVELADNLINPVSRTFQQYTAKGTGQEIIRNLDGTKAGETSSRSETHVKQRVFDLVQTASIFLGPELAEAKMIPKFSSRIEAGSLKEFKSLVQQLSKPGSELTQAELEEFEKLTEHFGGKLRYDLNPIKGKNLQPHVQVEGLGGKEGSRHIWLNKAVK